MFLNSLFDSLRLDPNVPLRDSGGAMLQESLNQSNIIAVFFVYLRSVPLPEAVSADPLKAQVVAHDTELLLHGPLGDGENQIVAADIVAQAVVLDILLDHQRDSEHAALAGFLFGNLQAVAFHG